MKEYLVSFFYTQGKRKFWGHRVVEVEGDFDINVFDRIHEELVKDKKSLVIVNIIKFPI